MYVCVYMCKPMSMCMLCAQVIEKARKGDQISSLGGGGICGVPGAGSMI